MSRRALRTTLWLGLLLMAPVPVLLGVATGFMPVARLLLLAGVCLAVVVVEGARGAVDLLAFMLLAQALVAAGVWLAVAAVAARGLARLPRPWATVTVVLVLGLGVVLTSSVAWYQTPFRSAGVQTSLWEVFE